MSRTRAQYIINKRLKLVETAPEKVVQAIAEEIGKNEGFIVEFNQPIRVAAEPGDFIPSYVFQIDHFLHSPNFKKQICLHTDGVYHDTAKQEHKDKWKDRLIVANGMRSIHVDAGLTMNQKLRDYLKAALWKAIRSEKDVIELHA